MKQDASPKDLFIRNQVTGEDVFKSTHIRMVEEIIFTMCQTP